MSAPRNSDGGGDLIFQIAFLIGGAYAMIWLDWARYVPLEWREAAVGIAYLALAVVGVSVARKLARGLSAAVRFVRSILPSKAHGSAAWASRRDARRAGLHHGAGLFIGAHEGRVLRFDNPAHSLILAPTRAGKGVSGVLQQLGCVETSMLVTDMKGELAAVSAAHRRDHLDHDVIALNPPRQLGLEAHAYNVLDILKDDLALAPEDAVSDARGISLQLHREPAKSDGNAHFRGGARLVLTAVNLGLCVKAPDEASLVTAYRIIAEPPVLMQFLEDLRGEPALSGDVAAMAESLLATAKGTPKEFQSFVNGAVQALEPFAPSGRLAKMSDRSTFRFRQLKERPTTIYLGCDLTRMAAFAPVIALWNWAAMTELQRVGDATPVLILLDEAANFVIDGLPNTLTGLTGYGVRVYMVFQELEAITKAYGREAQATILSQTPLKQFFGISSHETAELISKMLGSQTIEAPSFNLGQTGLDGVGENRGFMARPLMTADEIRRLPKDQQIVLIENLPPFLAHKIGYHETAPTRDQLAPNPFHGRKRYRGRLKVRLSPWPQVYGIARRPLSPPGAIRAPKLWPRVLGRLGAVLAGPLLRLGIAGALAAAIYLYGAPYLRVNYTYYGQNPFAPDRLISCLYVGWGAFEKRGPNCPIILWRKFWEE